jgi:hypothetical protein
MCGRRLYSVDRQRYELEIPISTIFVKHRKSEGDAGAIFRFVPKPAPPGNAADSVSLRICNNREEAMRTNENTVYEDECDMKSGRFIFCLGIAFRIRRADLQPVENISPPLVTYCMQYNHFFRGRIPKFPSSEEIEKMTKANGPQNTCDALFALLDG